MTQTEAERNQHEQHERGWIEKARAGESAAISWLYERYSTRVYSYAYVKLGDPDEAADVTQQVFLKVLEKLDGFQWHGAGFAAWLFRIAHNQIVDTQRRNARRQHLPIDAAGSMLSGDSTDPAKYAEGRDFLDRVRHAMLQLSELQVQVVTLRYAAELSNTEIAEVMSKTPNAVNSLHYEALKKLGTVLTAEGYTP